MNVYTWRYEWIVGIMLAGVFAWNLGAYCIRIKVWKILNIVGTIGALLIILIFTVAGREAGQQYVFMFAAEYSGEFWREMIMNVFLFFPFGLTLSSVIGWRPVVVGFLLTVSVEAWQYFSGTGLAQGTDIICNTLGAALGNLGTIMRK